MFVSEIKEFHASAFSKTIYIIPSNELIMLTYLLIRTKHGKNRIAHDKLKKHNEFLEVHEVFGRYDLVCLVETDDLKTLKTFIHNKIWIIEDLESVEPLIISTLDEPAKAVEEPIDEVTDIIEETDEDGQFLPP